MCTCVSQHAEDKDILDKPSTLFDLSPHFFHVATMTNESSENLNSGSQASAAGTLPTGASQKLRVHNDLVNFMCERHQVLCYGCQIGGFVGLLTVRASVALTPLLALENLSLLLVCLLQPQYEDVFLVLLYLFFPSVYCCVLVAWRGRGSREDSRYGEAGKNGRRSGCVEKF